MTTRHLDDLLRHALLQPDSCRDISRLLALPDLGDHLDDEAIAAVLDGTPSSMTVAHLLRCPPCEARAADADALLAGTPAPFTSSPPPFPVVAAHLVLDGDRLDLAATTGVVRTRDALAVRGSGESPLVVLRDRATQPGIELSVLPGPRLGRFSAIARVRATASTTARLFARGRLIAQAPFDDGAVTLPDLRPDRYRIEVRDADRRVATAWLVVTTP